MHPLDSQTNILFLLLLPTGVECRHSFEMRRFFRSFRGRVCRRRRIFGVDDAFAWAADDGSLLLRVFLDPVAVEAFANGGRVASTAAAENVPTALAVNATGPAAVEVYALASIYA